MTTTEQAICRAVREALREEKPHRTAGKVAQDAGVDTQRLSNISAGRVKPTKEEIDAIRDTLRKPSTWPLVAAAVKTDGHRVSLAGTPLAPIVVVGAASAGPGTANVDTVEDVIYVPERLSHIGGLGWIVDGESMMPILEPGDVAIFREGSRPRKGFTYLIKSVDGEFRVKTLDWIDNKWTMRSLNPTFQPEPLDGHQLIGFLIGWYRAKGSRETMDSDPEGLVL